MAGDWIKMRVDLAEDPAVIAMATKLSIDEFCIVGRLHKLWSWADKHCADGHAKGVTNVWINKYVCHTDFAECLQQVGWLAVTDDGVSFPQFDRHNGESAKKRIEAAERKRLQRILEQSAIDAAKCPSHVLEMSQQNCDESVTREEKRREELTSKAYVLGQAEDAPLFSSIDVPAKPDCPHQEIIAIYHEVLPQCPQIRDWTPARATQLRARWNEDPNRQNLGYWRRFFEYVKGCDFLVGRAGKAPFFADLEWLTKSANFTKIREEKYANRT